MQIVSDGDNLHEMLDPVSWEMSSAENFTQNAEH